jgi:hypothetical protein
MNLVDKYLDDLHNESIASSIGSGTGRVVGATVRTAAKVAGKTIYHTGKIVGNTAVGFGRGLLNAKKAKAAKIVAKKSVRKPGGLWSGIKRVNKAVKAPGKKLFNNK